MTHSEAAKVLLALLTVQLNNAIEYGAQFSSLPPYTAATDKLDEIGRQGLALGAADPHMATANAGASFTRRQVSPSIALPTYALHTDVMSALDLATYEAMLKQAIDDPRTHAFLDRHHEACWTSKNHLLMVR